MNTVAFVSQESNTKYLNIRPEYAQKLLYTCNNIDTIDSIEVPTQSSTVTESKRSSCNSWFDQESYAPPQPPSRRRNTSSSNVLVSNKNLGDHKYVNVNDFVYDVKVS